MKTTTWSIDRSIVDRLLLALLEFINTLVSAPV